MSNITTTFRGLPSEPANEEEQIFYSEASAVASAIETTVLTYTVPVSKEFFIHRIEASGTNKADYKIKINGITTARAYSYFTLLTHIFDFTAGPKKGYMIVAGDVVTVTVIHSRPYVGDFSVRLQGLEVS